MGPWWDPPNTPFRWWDFCPCMCDGDMCKVFAHRIPNEKKIPIKLIIATLPWDEDVVINNLSYDVIELRHTY